MYFAVPWGVRPEGIQTFFPYRRTYMSVKKSLWISLALVAMSLVFLGCPTEASESSGGGRDYEDTELWIAIRAAETNLNATPVSALAGADIVTTENYVTPQQYAAFSGAIATATVTAKSQSAKVAAPTAAEQAAKDKLVAAQAQFEGQKKPGEATEAKTAADLASGNQVVIGKIDLGDDTTISTANTLITVAAGAKLTTVSGKTFNLKDESTIALRIKNGGTFEIVSGTNVEADNFKGKIIVEEGGTFIDKTAGGLFVGGATDDSGSYEINVGGVLISGTTILVGPTAGANRGQQFQLKSGKIEVKAPAAAAVAGTPTQYTLTGDADLAGSLKVDSLAINGTLTVADKVDLYGVDSATLLTGSSGAKIILAGTGSSITVLNTTWNSSDDAADARSDAAIAVKIAGNGTWAFGGGTAGTKFSGHTVSGFRLTGLTSVLQWSGSEWAQ
jgi:hypothetical protein